MRLTRLVFALASALLAACSLMTEVRLYPGPEKDTSQIARLYLDPHVLVSQVDDTREHPTDKSRVLAHSAGARREYIAVDPGVHSLKARFFMLCLRSEEFPLTFNAEPGKSYRLKSVVDMDQKRWAPSIIEHDGEPVEDTAAWWRAMCPVNFQVITLKR